MEALISTLVISLAITLIIALIVLGQVIKHSIDAVKLVNTAQNEQSSRESETLQKVVNSVIEEQTHSIRELIIALKSSNADEFVSNIADDRRNETDEMNIRAKLNNPPPAPPLPPTVADMTDDERAANFLESGA